MSLKSMTGCGRGSAIGGGVRVDVELSSVNRKQFDAHVNLPKALLMLEPRVDDLIHKSISRGNVAGAVNVTVSGGALEQCISVASDTAKTYIRVLRKTARELGLKDDLTARCLVSLPGVIKYESMPGDSEKIWPLLNKALRLALTRLTSMRVKEGKSLQKDLLRRLSLLKRELEGIKTVAPVIARKYRDTLQERIEKAGINGGLNNEQLVKEVAIFADRSDISEEIVRLESHFMQVSSLMKSSAPVGRTLDFLCQEMFREINTIGSKANSEIISGSVVRFKAGLESVREQVQNVE
ncbi:MAG: YicC family protein [Kiritimatiellae bacterium]|nr:YicC family protein [Kiritimatiellia bacterium]MDD5521463.1 YicC family protein [Kiritimatiellia bacterium]